MTRSTKIALAFSVALFSCGTVRAQNIGPKSEWGIHLPKDSYCLAGVCLGMTVDKLPPELFIPPPLQGTWFDKLGMPEPVHQDEYAIAEMKRTHIYCGTGDDRHQLHPTSSNPFAQFVIDVEAMPKTRVTDSSAYMVTGISFYTELPKDEENRLHEIILEKWPGMTYSLTSNRSTAVMSYVDYANGTPQDSVGPEVVLVVRPATYTDPAEAERVHKAYVKGAATFRFGMFPTEEQRKAAKRAQPCPGNQPSAPSIAP